MIQKILLILLASASAIMPSAPVLAQSQSDFYSESEIILFDENASGPVCGNNGTTLVGNDNIEQGFNYFIGKGMTPEQSAGIVGNLIVESGGAMDPAVKQFSGGPGRGIAQWEVGGRWDTLLKWAADNNREPINLATQLDFLWYEFETTESTAFEAVKATTTTEQAAAEFMLKFERPRDKSQDAQRGRAEIALGVIARYGGGAAGAGGGTAAPCGGGSGGVNPDGYAFPVAPQTKSANRGLSVPCNKAGCHHDGTPAADISRQPGGKAAEGAAVYAITDGTIASLRGLNSGGGISNNCYIIHFLAKDSYYYAYLHIKNPLVQAGSEVVAGAKIAEIGNFKCGYSTVEHLHIDRGCTRGGVPQRGGSDGCRDPEFVPLLDNIYNALPE